MSTALCLSLLTADVEVGDRLVTLTVGATRQGSGATPC